MNNTAFFTVIYPAVINYLDDFFSSLEKQSTKLFDVVVMNDGVEDFDFSKYDLNINVIASSGTPSKIREKGINYLIDKRYDFAVFGDSDDYFDESRIKHVIGLLTDFDVVINDLTLVDKMGSCLLPNYLSNRLENLEEIDSEFMGNKNVFGLSNTAIKLDSLEKVTFPEDLIAVDWFFYSTFLSRGGSAVFTSRAVTYYRQHEANTAGFQEITYAKALGGALCKSIHYCALSTLLPDEQQLGIRFGKLYQKLSDDDDFLKLYVDSIKENNIDCPLWWEQIVLPKEFL